MTPHIPATTIALIAAQVGVAAVHVERTLEQVLSSPAPVNAAVDVTLQRAPVGVTPQEESRRLFPDYHRNNHAAYGMAGNCGTGDRRGSTSAARRRQGLARKHR